MNFLSPENIGPVPAQSQAAKNATVWLEEDVFGHRLWARQTPWLLFLEFLNVAEAFLRDGKEKLFAASQPEEMRSYKMRFRMGLRHILFDNEEMARISLLQFNDDGKWETWLAAMRERGVEGGFDYLKQRFPQFSHFSELVALVKQTTLETDTNRRWSSRFIFPFGPDALYSDAIVKESTPQADFNNFGRTGEILYMMLSRSKGSERLREHFAELLDPQRAKNQLIARLSAPSDNNPDRDQKGETYLPYRTHPAFDRLAEDWLSVLDLGLPEQDAYAYLVPLGALHVILYQLETAAALVGREGRPPIICEMIAPRREFVRQRAIASYQDNDSLSLEALRSNIDRALETEEWRDIHRDELSESERLEAAADFFDKRFSYSPKDGGAATTVAELVEQLRQDVETKHEASCGRVHSDYGRYIGLSSRRGTNRMRYAPTDALLKILVITRVTKRVEFKKFLADLFAHYGFVFGEAEAALALDTTAFHSSAFERNRGRLEARLGSMGLLNRLSDGCAYVVNPFAIERSASDE
ncbi:hypothetical protein ACC805_12315 [Rhizobium ruizarguesonis]